MSLARWTPNEQFQMPANERRSCALCRGERPSVTTIKTGLDASSDTLPRNPKVVRVGRGNRPINVGGEPHVHSEAELARGLLHAQSHSSAAAEKVNNSQRATEPRRSSPRAA